MMGYRRQIWFNVFFIFLGIVCIISLNSKMMNNGKDFCYKCISSLPTSVSLPVFNSPVNTEDGKISIDDLSILCLDLGWHLHSEQLMPFSSLLHAPPVNAAGLRRFPYRYSLWKSSFPLTRVMTPCEHSLLMRLLMIVERICRKHRFTFFMAYGTLLGSWRHHDVIPWDGDVDIMMSVEDRPRLLDILKTMNNTLIQYNIYQFPEPGREYYKISFKHALAAGNRPWRFPFVDIYFYTTNNTHIWSRSHVHTLIEATHVFPLVMRPFGQLWLPAPRHPEYIIPLNANDVCIKGAYDYRTESFGQKHVSNCSQLNDIYPFVSRDSTRKSSEILKINKTIIHTVVYD